MPHFALLLPDQPQLGSPLMACLLISGTTTSQAEALSCAGEQGAAGHGAHWRVPRHPLPTVRCAFACVTACCRMELSLHWLVRIW